MDRELDSGSSGPGSSPDNGVIGVVLLGKTLYSLLSQCLSPARRINGYRRIVGATRLLRMLDVTCDGLSSHPGVVSILLYTPGHATETGVKRREL